MRVAVQIIITLILLWLYALPVTDTVFVRTQQYTGILPVSQQSLPLTPDDIARGLRANPTITVSSDLLTEAHRLRTNYAQKRAERAELVDTLGTQSLAILVALEEQ